MNQQTTSISSNILNLRKRLGFSQEQVASYLGVSNHTTISYYETGKREIPFEVLEKLADLYCVDLYDLMTEDVMEQNINIAFAYRAEELDNLAINTITGFNKIVKNYLKMKRLLAHE